MKKKPKTKSTNLVKVTDVMDTIHTAYDYMEAASWRAVEKVLREQLKFGDVRIARFRDEFMMNFGAEAEKMALEIRENLKENSVKWG